MPAFAGLKFDFLDITGMIEATEEILEYPMVDRDPLTRWSFGRITLLGDAAHPMYPRGSNGAGQAIVDARFLTGRIKQLGATPDALHRLRDGAQSRDGQGRADQPQRSARRHPARGLEPLGRQAASRASRTSCRPPSCEAHPRALQEGRGLRPRDAAQPAELRLINGSPRSPPRSTRVWTGSTPMAQGFRPRGPQIQR